MTSRQRGDGARRSTAGLVCRVAAVLGVVLLLVSVTGLLQLTRSDQAVREGAQGATLATMGVGVLVLGSLGTLLDRRARMARSRAVIACAVLSVLWPCWILFVRWYDAR